MAIRSRVVQDRRKISRVNTLLNCRFTHDGVSREAVIINLSLNGAFLSSKYLPPSGSTVVVTVKTPALKSDLKLEGKVVRGGTGMSEHGRLERFGIRFSYAPPDLITLITRLKR